MRNKKAVAGFMSPAFWTGILAVIGIIAIVLWAFNNFGGVRTQLQVTPPQGLQPSAPPAGGGNIISLVEDVTVTFSSWDFYSRSTNAGTGHKILEFNGDIGIEVNDDATRTGSPGNMYKVLVGNRTTSLVKGTDYYPVYVTGVLPDKGTFTVSAGQFKTAGSPVFTFFDENDQTGNYQTVNANDKRTVSYKIRAPDNECVGNPATGGQNAFTFRYNNTVWTKVVQLDPSGNDLSAIGTPTGVNITEQHTLRTYPAPVVCDNAEFKRSVRLESGTNNPASKDNINITVSDITYDFDADSFELIVGYEDEDNNDIGISDYIIASLKVS